MYSNAQFSSSLAVLLTASKAALCILFRRLHIGDNSFLLAFRLVFIRSSVVLLSAMCIVLLFACAGEMRLGRMLNSLSFFGNATYSSYLIHFPIQLVLVSIIDVLGYERSIFLNSSALILYLTTVIGASLAVYHIFERPAQNWIRSRASHLKWLQPA